MIYIHAKNTVTSFEAPDSIETDIHNLLMHIEDVGAGMGYSDAFIQHAYERGLNDAWECARKIVCDCNYPNNHLRQYVTNGDTLVKFFTDNSASEAISKVNQYEVEEVIKQTKGV